MTGIYSRQSLFKKDSLSIEAQIDLCRKQAGEDEVKIYQDAGFSGKNTNRPAFQEMMNDVQSGKLDKIICYRIDRISRSIADFGDIWDTLSKNKVELLSVSEQFDTSTPIGKAMLYIIMVFAQMERETIAQRVTDNYYKRTKEGAWPGGPAPFGFDLVRRELHGKIQTVLQPNELLREAVWLFEQYSSGAVSLGKLATAMRQKQVGNLTWTNVAVRRILINPVYAAADADLYAYYAAQGTQIMDDLQHFDGKHSALILGYRHAGRELRRPISEQKLYITSTEPVVSSAIFVRVQHCLAQNQQIKNSRKSQYSWLAGLMKCSECGYSLRLVHDPKVSTTKAYINCTNRSSGPRTCKLRHTERIETVESQVSKQIVQRMKALSESGGMLSANPDDVRKSNELKLQLLEIQSRQKNLIEAISVGGAAAVRLLTPELEKLDAQSTELSEQISKLNSRKNPWLPNVLVDFSSMALEEQRHIAASLIDRVIVGPDTVDIYWI